MAEPIAIVGMACRFPGGVTDPESLWHLLVDGVDAIREVERDGLDLATYFDATPRTPGRMMTRWGGFLDDLARFDAAFFGISPREAASVDPAQRLLLETTWEACEDAAIDPHTMAGGSVGVFVGQWLSDFEARLFADTEQVDFHATTGSGRYASSGRLSFVLGTTGPSITVDTACSSSLVAVHLACQSLRSGESTTAIAAGVNVILQPHITIAYSQSGMMAADGRCKFGDAKGDGYVRSEGAGVVLLKPLAAALAAGDPIRAVIRGSAVNNDGRGSGHLATPSRDGQTAMLRTAYAGSGVAPHRVGYVEAHGTGTRAGDPVEIGALGDVLTTDRQPGSRCLLGSVKTNIGHTEGAAGMAGLMKCVLALEHAQVPGSLHLDEPNPAIPWADLPFEIPQHLVPWPDGNGPTRFAGVSAFGITGTNAHLVLEQAPAERPIARPGLTDDGRPAPLVLSAASVPALEALAGAYAAVLAAPNGPSRRDVCATAARHRAALEHRAVFVAAATDDLVDRLRRFAGGEVGAADVTGSAPVSAPRRIAFVFPGQGGQWPGMGRQLLIEEPAFAAAIDACDAALPPGTDWTVRGQLEAGADGPHRLDEIAVLQPTLLAVEIALAAMWRAWGIVPEAVVGHSMGEVGAAHVAGVLTIADAMHVICTRSALLQRTAGAGAMALLDASAEDAEARIAPFDGRVVVAVSNGPRSTVVSGDPGAVAAVLAGCERDGVFARAVKVDVASHSGQMDPLVPELVAELHGLAPRDPTARLYSTVDAALRPGGEWDAAYWGRNLRQPVLFGRTVERMVDDGIDAVIEVSPHPTLLPGLAHLGGPDGRSLVSTGSLRRDADERTSLLVALGVLWASGHPVDWSAPFPRRGYVRVPLPHYPWQRQRHWSPAAAPVDRAGGVRHRALDEHLDAWLRVLRWEAAPPAPRPPGAPGRWLLVGADEDVQPLRTVLELVGGAVGVVTSIEEAGASVDGPGLRIVFLPSPRATAFDAVSALQALHASRPADDPSAPHIWWVTRGAQVLVDDDVVDDASEQAALWGAAQVAAVEHPDWWGGLVDLDPSIPVTDQLDALAVHLLADDGEDLVALRGGLRHVLRLEAGPPSGRAPFAWRTDAAYLVTGAFGGVAEHIVAAMVRDGARRLVLLVRAGLPPRRAWAAVDPTSELGRRIAVVRTLERAGAAVHLLEADVGDEAQVRAALDAYDAEGWPPIAGVVHAAVELDSRLTGDLDRTSFDVALRAKLGGARILDQALPDLDLFVVFSSITAFWPTAGIANYVAANAGLDALARSRRARGRHALSIEWGPWDQVGLHGRAAGGNFDVLERAGVGALSVDEGVACFASLLTQDEPVVAVLPIDWATFRQAHRGRDLPLFRSAPGADTAAVTAPDGIAAQLERSSPIDRLALLDAVVRDAVAGVLRLPAAQLDARRPFGLLGLDSLMALELRNRLETTLERRLSATLAWNYPTVEALAAHLDLLVAGVGPTVTSDVPVVAPLIQTLDLVSDVVALSDEDVLRSIRERR